MVVASLETSTKASTGNPEQDATDKAMLSKSEPQNPMVYITVCCLFMFIYHQFPI
jgi:hypothetical protein